MIPETCTTYYDGRHETRYPWSMTPLDRVREICMALPGAYEKLSHGTPCFFIEKKRQFCSFVDNHHGDGRLALWLPAKPGIQEMLIAEDPEVYFRPPYVGPSGWIGVRLDQELSWKTVEDHIVAAHEFAGR